MSQKPKVTVTHTFQPDPEAVRRGIELLINLSNEARARKAAREQGRNVEAS